MKKFIFLFLYIFSINAHNYLTEYIGYLHPYPQPSSLFEIRCIDTLRAVAIGTGGSIIYTSDGGEHWSIINSGISNNLWSIYFSDKSTGWICGDEGIILKTIDTCKTWKVINTNLPNDASLSAICFSDNTFGWIGSGYSGFTMGKDIYARTTDGGNSWIYEEKYLELYSFCKASIGLGRESTGFVVKTVDTGKTWYNLSVVAPPARYSRQMLCLVGSNFAYLHTTDTTGGILLKTRDCGLSWEKINNRYSTFSLYFPDARKGFGGTKGWDSSVIPAIYGTAIQCTNDSGRTWNKVVLPEIDGSTEFTSFHGVDTTHVIAVGATGAIAYTKDGGKTWGHNNVITRKSLYAVYFTDSNHGWASGESQTVIRTADGGKTWKKSVIKDMWGFPGQLFFFNNLHGIAFSYGNVPELWETFDSGITWNKKSNIPTIGATKGDYFDSNTIAITGDTTGCVVLSSNGGTSWNVVQVEQGAQKRITSVTYQNSKTLFATGLQGIYKSTDGGQQWSLKNSIGNISEFTCVKVLTNGYGYAATYHGEIYKTQDHGKTWIGLGIPFECDIAYLSVTDSQICCFPGLAYGLYGMAFYTIDGGKTWKKANYPAHTSWANGIFALGRTDWVIAHAFGGVSRLTIDTVVTGVKNENINIKNKINNFQLIYVNKALGISFNSQNCGRITVKLFNISGKKVSSYSLVFSSNGLQEFSIPLKHFSKGAYLVSVSEYNFKYNRKIIIH